MKQPYNRKSSKFIDGNSLFEGIASFTERNTRLPCGHPTQVRSWSLIPRQLVPRFTTCYVSSSCAGASFVVENPVKPYNAAYPRSPGSVKRSNSHVDMLRRVTAARFCSLVCCGIAIRIDWLLPTEPTPLDCSLLHSDCLVFRA